MKIINWLRYQIPYAKILGFSNASTFFSNFSIAFINSKAVCNISNIESIISKAIRNFLSLVTSENLSKYFLLTPGHSKKSLNSSKSPFYKLLLK